MFGGLLKSFSAPRRAVETPPRQPVAVDRSTPAAALRTLAQAYVQGDPDALMACLDDRDSAWPRGRVQGWAGFVEAAGRLRRAADAAFGAGCGDALVREVLERDPKVQGLAMLDLLARGAFAKVSADAPTVAVSESFVLGPTWLVRTDDGWKIAGGPDHQKAAPKIDPQLLREAMDRSDRLVVADAETAHLLADGIESGGLPSINKARHVGERERTRARDRAGCTDKKFSQRLLAAVGRNSK